MHCAISEAMHILNIFYKPESPYSISRLTITFLELFLAS